MKYNIYKPFYTVFLLALVFMAGCKKEYESIEVIDQRSIKEYLQKNNLTASFKDTLGVYYQIITPGTGAVVDYTDKVFATFSAKSLDGSFNLQDDGLNRFTDYLGYFSRERGNGYPNAFAMSVKEILKKKGGTIRVIIPSSLAYGRDGNTALNIPGNASLDCTIKVYDVNNKTEFEDIFVKKFIQDNSISGLTRLNSGLYYKIIDQGTGSEITENSNVTVSYTGKLSTGTIFDESASYTTYLYSTIPGWVQGLPFVKKGGKIRLIIPPSLGYASLAQEKIPPYSILDFEIEVLDVTD